MAIVTILASLGLTIWLGWFGHDARTELEQTRRSLRQAGFKLELAEFDFTQSGESKTRADALDKAGGAAYLLLAEAIDLLPPVGANSALVLSVEPKVIAQPRSTEPVVDLWAALREKLNHAVLAEACPLAIAGPFRTPVTRTASGGLTRGGSGACRLPASLAAKLLLALHDHDTGTAWTNLLALTCLVGRWQEAPYEHDLFYWRGVNMRDAYGATWQAVQAHVLTEAQLAELQRVWETADFRRGAAEMAALARATVETEFQADSRAKRPPFRPQWLGPPRQTYQQIAEWWRLRTYRSSVRYRDEEALLRLFRICEEDYRQVEARPTWREIAAMKQLGSQPAGFTNVTVSRVPPPSMDDRYNHLSGVSAIHAFAFGSRMRSLERMAGSETMRRLLVAALALERYRLRHGAYPESPGELTPEFLASCPVDFIDGEPLRYRREGDGRFLLYGIGLDLRDHGGLNRPPGALWSAGPDHVWPRPATRSEIEAECAARRGLPTNQTEGRTFLPLD